MEVCKPCNEMTDEERQARFDELHNAELAKCDLGMWWLSFADGDKPKGTQFLGVVILEAYGFTDAIVRCNALRLNPGGEVQGFQIEMDFVPEALRNRLLKKRDLAGFGVDPNA